jgi:MoxR-like ATPase
MTTEGKLVVDPLGKALPHLAAMVAMVRTKELSEMSNRRLVKFSAIVLAEALLRSAQADAAEAEILPRDLGVILTYGLDQDDPGTVAKMRQDLLLG